MARGRVVVEVEVRPTEDPEKVKAAILNIIDPDEIRWEELGNTKILIAEARSLRGLTKFHRLLRQQRILDAARAVLRKSITGNSIVLHLHKQALTQGKISLVSGDHESPLGAVRVTIEHPEIRAVIDWLAPATAMGRPLWERDMPE